MDFVCFSNKFVDDISAAFSNSTAHHCNFASTSSWIGLLDLLHSKAVCIFKSSFTRFIVFQLDLFPNSAHSTAVQTAVAAELKA